MNSTREDRPRLRPLVRFIGLPLGLLFLAIGFNRPSIANMRTVDLLYLLGTGATLGAGLVGLVLHFVHPREGDKKAPKPVPLQVPESTPQAVAQPSSFGTDQP